MTQLLEEAIAQLKHLPEDWQDAIAARLLAEIQAEPSGTPGYKLLRFAGSIPAEDLQIMAEAIQEDCNRIDIDEW
ncbi:hypothetical protein [Roseofilum sp. Guam]|uniref:hypothetical protein n=1 Tax=Roseofilum sp. Guam TaxID=2821502 RepID=UPI001B1B6E64|nr:hypothetical protein [Roseofilum sp. Guam]MBP0028182.1 hypothetical protein [Roseofilum sp. Guam]